MKIEKFINSKIAIKFHLLRFKKINPQNYKKNIKFSKIFYSSINLLHRSTYSNRFWQILGELYVNQIVGYDYFVKFFKLDKFQKSENFSFIPNNSHNQFMNSVNNGSILDNIIHLNKVHKNITSLNIKPVFDNVIIKKNSIKLFLVFFVFNKISLLLNFFFNFKLIATDIFNLKLFLISLKNKKTLFFLPDKKIEKKLNEFNPQLRRELFDLGRSHTADAEELELWYLICFLMPLPLIENFYIDKAEHKFNCFFLSQLNMDIEKKIYIASQVENGVKLKLFNHGGNYFSFNCAIDDYHEVQISDIFFSWADTNFLKSEDSFSCKAQKIIHQIPTFNIINKNKIKKHDFVLINNTFRFLPYPCRSNPALKQIDKQMKDTLKFLDRVIEKTDNFLIKDLDFFHNIDPMNYYNKKYKERVTSVNLNKLVSESKIGVSSYYGTPFHHLMANDIPNIIFIKLSYYDFNKVFLSYLKEFHKFQVVHFNPLSAAKFVENNIENIEDIWNETELVKLRKDFNLKFNQSPYNWQKKINNIL
jgi:putative transferase (TIGR04331 family)